MAKKKPKGVLEDTLVPFLRRHDPDQVQGFGFTPSQRQTAHPSDGGDNNGVFGFVKEPYSGFEQVSEHVFDGLPDVWPRWLACLT